MRIIGWVGTGLADCAVRGDQRDRKPQIEAAAWRILSADPDFMRMREANAALAASTLH
ncbi:hypothetical protein [Paraburkholderia susongensis]|uniref:hypothetical protein n=1 Tax=Paraburkholderia susongensis TaxID=1515439 RepID=UPI00142D1C57|nr:hypothetical protein [Paraburkholderia susongensis]